MECSGADLKTRAAWEDKQFGTGSTYTGQPTLEKYDDSKERLAPISIRGIWGQKSKPTSYKRPPPRQIFSWSKVHRGVYLRNLTSFRILGGLYV